MSEVRWIEKLSGWTGQRTAVTRSKTMRAKIAHPSNLSHRRRVHQDPAASDGTNTSLAIRNQRKQAMKYVRIVKRPNANRTTGERTTNAEKTRRNDGKLSRVTVGLAL